MRATILLALLCACGPSTTDSDGGNGGAADAASPDAGSSCTLTVSGDLSATMPCSVAAVKTAADPFSIVAGMTSTGSATVSQVLFSMRVTGEVAVRDYSAGELMQVALMLSAADGKIYAASSGGTQGTIGTLRITGLMAQSGGDTGDKVWTPHGSFTATLVGTTSGGTVMMSVTF